MFSGKINMAIRFCICKHDVRAFERGGSPILNLLVFTLLVICLYVEILRALFLMMMILQHSLWQCSCSVRFSFVYEFCFDEVFLINSQTCSSFQQSQQVLSFTRFLLSQWVAFSHQSRTQYFNLTYAGF